MVLLRTSMIYECDLESERDLSFNPLFLIYTKQYGGKYWKIYNGIFLEVLKENLTSSIGKSGILSFANEKIKNVSFGFNFLVVPNISIVLDQNEGSIPYKTNSTVSGFTINFKTNYTGNVWWAANKI